LRQRGPHRVALLQAFRRILHWTSEQQFVSGATTSYGIDTNWYTDAGATDHIASQLEKLTVGDKYHGTDNHAFIEYHPNYFVIKD
jgi:hypothetical protein